MNPMLASAQFITTVTVEYTSRGDRVRKDFSGKDAIAASRRFYAAKLKAKADPRIVGARRVSD